MIIVKIFQGPGNQLFQYAYGLAAAKRMGVPLKLDVSWYESFSSHRAYILDRFNISAEIATPQEIQYVKSKDGPNFLAYRWNLLRDAMAPVHKKVLINEDIQQVNLKFKYPYKNTYVTGYFTSEDFFADHSDLIRKELQFKGEVNEKNKAVVDLMKSTNSVALSIRRGDFLNKKWQNICSIEYYYRAIEILKKENDHLNFFVFSDELDWVKKNMKFNCDVQYMDFNLPDYMMDMRLMTHCKHHIITNSTFSWWGAWLSGSTNVICPENWLNPDLETHKQEFNGQWVDFSHVLPNRWRKIHNFMPGETEMPIN